MEELGGQARGTIGDVEKPPFPVILRDLLMHSRKVEGLPSSLARDMMGLEVEVESLAAGDRRQL